MCIRDRLLYICLIKFWAHNLWLEFWILRLPWNVVVVASPQTFSMIGGGCSAELCSLSVYGFTEFTLFHLKLCTEFSYLFWLHFYKFWSLLLARICQHTIERVYALTDGWRLGPDHTQFLRMCVCHDITVFCFIRLTPWFHVIVVTSFIFFDDASHCWPMKSILLSLIHILI